MIARISVFLIALTVLAAPAAVQADKPKAKPVKKFAILFSDGAESLGVKVAQPIEASYLMPNGFTAAAACKGKITFSAPIGKKTVKKKGKKVKVTVLAKKSGKLELAGLSARCTSRATLTLPAALLSKKVKFTATFKGNSAVKPFVKSKKMTVVKKADPVVPPPKLRAGPWTVTETGASGAPRQWGFTIGTDNSLTKRTDRYGTINVHCPGPHADRVLDYSPNAEAPFDDTNTIATNPFTATDLWTNPDDAGEHATQKFNFTFTSETSGTGTFQLTGTFRAISTIAALPDLVSDCSSDVIPVKVEYGAAA